MKALRCDWPSHSPFTLNPVSHTSDTLMDIRRRHSALDTSKHGVQTPMPGAKLYHTATQLLQKQMKNIIRLVPTADIFVRTTIASTDIVTHSGHFVIHRLPIHWSRMRALRDTRKNYTH